MKTPILFVTHGPVHPTWPQQLAVKAAITATGRYTLRTRRSFEALSEADLAGARAVVFYAQDKEISEQALARLEGYINSGGGLLGIHAASASFKQKLRWHTLLGGRFTSHGPVERFQVVPVERAGDIFHASEPFSLTDERYLHEVKPDSVVRFYSANGEEREPFVWTRQAGDGRVCYCAAGHTWQGVTHPSIRQILQDGLAWVCGEALR